MFERFARACVFLLIGTVLVSPASAQVVVPPPAQAQQMLQNNPALIQQLQQMLRVERDDARPDSRAAEGAGLSGFVARSVPAGLAEFPRTRSPFRLTTCSRRFGSWESPTRPPWIHFARWREADARSLATSRA